jgi:hypothetical protein
LVDLIIGCNSFANWEALIDFDRILQLNYYKGEQVALFINEENANDVINDVMLKVNLLE